MSPMSAIKAEQGRVHRLTPGPRGSGQMGRAGGTRTHDPGIMSPLLSPAELPPLADSAMVKILGGPPPVATDPPPHPYGRWGIAKACSRGWTRTSNLPVNSRTLCQLSYAGSSETDHLRPA
jgi:hypothetical protein